MKRYVWLALVAVGCGPLPPPGPPPVPPPMARAVGALVRDQAGQGIAGAICRLQDTPGWVSATSAAPDGYVLWTPVLVSLRATQVECAADGYVPLSESRALTTGGDENLAPIILQPAHVDPSRIPLEQLAAIRGAMWTARLNLPFGPRPGQDDNIIATDFMAGYSATDQRRIIATLQARGYTHVVLGPIVDSDGYHGQYEARDWRGPAFEQFLDVVQLFWDHGLAPVIFIHPDGWALEQTQALTPLFTSPRAQRLMRIVVPFGWEPGKYEISSWTWAAYGAWARQTWPTALVLLHTVCDVDAPAGTDARGDDNGQGNQTAWARVVPVYHGWLTQSCAFADPIGHGDLNHPDKTNFQNWTDLFNPSVRGSYRDRFEHGYAGWPTGSAWGPSAPLLVYAGEYAAYWSYWHNRPEAESQDWGDAAIMAGAAGYLDGGRLPMRQHSRTPEDR